MSKQKAEAVKQPKNSPSKPSKPRKASPPARKATAGSWTPGVSGNPRGRPKTGNSLAEIFREYMSEKAPLPGVKKRKWRVRGELLAIRLFDLAIEAGSVAAARLLIDTISNYDLEARLAALEGRVQALLEENHRGRLN